MSQPVHDYLRGLFGSKSGADCHVRFKATAVRGSAQKYVGDPLPAHQLVLRGGSERFRAQLEALTLEASSGDARTTAKRPRVDGCRETLLPELAVRLGSESELAPTLAAIRFMYTGSVVQPEHPQGAHGGQQHGASDGGNYTHSDNSISTLLLIRRQAVYLRVQGCAEACDAALVDWFAKVQVDSGDRLPLFPVLQLHSRRQLLPSPEADPRVGAILHACCQYLQRHWGPHMAAGRARERTPLWQRVLAWLLGNGNTVRIANDPQLLQRWLSMPAGALELLLQSDQLSTDDEGTVVVLVELWVTAQGGGVTEADRGRVRQQLRLVNCSPSYLFDVLPKLPLMGPEAAQQAAFMARCRLMDRSEWKAMGCQMGWYDTSSPWYGIPRPQPVPDVGLSHRWEISRADLLAGLKKEGSVKNVEVIFHNVGSSSGGKCAGVVALGFVWGLFMQYKVQEAQAGMFISCEVPPAFGTHRDKVQGAARASVSVDVSVSGGVKHSMQFLDCHVAYGASWGQPKLLPLEVPQPAAGPQEQLAEAGEADAALLAPWAELLGPEGKLRGELVFKAKP